MNETPMSPPAAGGVHPLRIVESVERQALHATDCDWAVLAESSSWMFWVGAVQARRPLQVRCSCQFGSMTHALSGSLGRCLATGQPSIVLSGDLSAHMGASPLVTAIKYGLALVVVVANDRRANLPYIGCLAAGALHASRTTSLPPTDFALLARAHGATGLTLAEDRDADATIASALATARAGGVVVVDALVRDVRPPIDNRIGKVVEQLGGAR